MRRLTLVVFVLLTAAAFGCDGEENGPSVAEPTVTGTTTATARPSPTRTPRPSPFVTPTPDTSPTPLPDPERTVEGTGSPAGCFPSSPSPSETAADLGEPTRYSRGIYTIGLDGGGPILFVERRTAVVGAAAWNPLYQTYSATLDGSALAFVAGQQVKQDRAELRLQDSSSVEPRLLATFNEIMNLAIAPQGDLVASMVQNRAPCSIASSRAT